MLGNQNIKVQIGAQTVTTSTNTGGHHQHTTQKYLCNLLHSNFYDELVIMGFPFDQGARNHQLRAGAYLGPDSFRRFLNSNFGVLKNVEYGLDIEQYLSKISDYGNISTETTMHGQVNVTNQEMEVLYAKLKTKTGLCLERNNRLFLVGGTKDMLLPLQDAYNATGSNTVFIVITNRLYGPTQNVAYKGLLDQSSEFKNVSTIFFGVSQEEAQKQGEQNGVQIDTSRVSFVDTNVEDILDVFQEKVLTNEKVQQASKILIHIDLESVREADGVTDPQADSEAVSCFGIEPIKQCSLFKAFDICQILQLVSRELTREKLGGISISDFNSIAEDQRTARVIAQMFYNVVLGVCQLNKLNGGQQQ